MSKKQKKIEKRGQKAAERYLELQGYKILDRNWECPAGEADIVAKDGDGSLVFVDVKVRTSLERGFPREKVEPEDRSRCEKVAAYYMTGCRDFDYPIRFDIVALLVIGEDRALIKHHVNAFGACC